MGQNSNKEFLRDVYVTQPALPALEKLLPYLETIWKSRILTNSGPMHARLEAELASYLDVPFVALFCNGTIALITALQTLRITGEVITSPFSFVATTHALNWNGIKPVFVDIEPGGLNLDPLKVEAAITPKTTAILPVHCFGRPCQVDLFQQIAECYNLNLIYDAAHAFGVADSEGSILRHGDLSVLSFHATKVFHTFEGGAIICHDAKTKARIDRLKNFGFVDEVTVVSSGINGKMSEFNAAFGLVLLEEIDEHLQRRAVIDQYYRQVFADIPEISCLLWPNELKANYCYFPIVVDNNCSLSRDKLYARVQNDGIFCRRYFYPLISDFPAYRGLPSAKRENLVNAYDLAERVLCLPMASTMTLNDAERVAQAVLDAVGRS